MSNLAKNLEYLLFEKRLSANQLQEQSGITQSTTTSPHKGRFFIALKIIGLWTFLH